METDFCTQNLIILDLLYQCWRKFWCFALEDLISVVFPRVLFPSSCLSSGSVQASTEDTSVWLLSSRSMRSLTRDSSWCFPLGSQHRKDLFNFKNTCRLFKNWCWQIAGFKECKWNELDGFSYLLEQSPLKKSFVSQKHLFVNWNRPWVLVWEDPW